MSTVITHKQFPNEKTWSMDLCGRPLTINMGKVAELATASALVTYGETTVLVVRGRPHRSMDQARSLGNCLRVMTVDMRVCSFRVVNNAGAALSRCEAVRPLGRFHFVSGKIRLRFAAAGFLPSLRSKLPRCPLLRASS